MATDTNASREAGSGMAANGSPPRDNLFRSLPENIEIRSDSQGGMPTLTGHFAVFDEWTEIRSRFEGHFMERFAPGAFKKTISEGRDRLRVLFNHGQDPTIGTKVLGPIEDLREDEKGAFYAVPLLDTSYNRDLLPGLKAKLYGASFRFGVVIEDFVQRPKASADNPNGIPERTVREAFVREFGPCTFGQYVGATSGVRSLTDEFVMAPLLEDPDRLRELVESRTASTGTGFTVTYTGTSAATNTQPSFSVSVPRSISIEETTRDAKVEREYKRCSAYLTEEAWAMEPNALKKVTAIVADRRDGTRLTADEIKARIGTRDEPPVSTDPGVAVITISGPIVPHADVFTEISGGASVDAITQQFRAALASEDVKSIVLNIDSPGGAVSMIPELGAEILASRGTKPIVAVANTFAGSAAYWLASAADEIVVSPSAKVGSIGVYLAHTDVSEQDKMLGEKTTLISAGKYKVEGNPYEPLTDDAAAHMQEHVDGYYDMFVAAVAKGRGVTAAEVRDGFGEGRMVMASDAVKQGMADKVATFDETLARMIKQKPAAAAANAETLEPEPSAATTPAEPGANEPERPVATTHPNTPRLIGAEPKKRQIFGVTERDAPEWLIQRT